MIFFEDYLEPTAGKFAAFGGALDIMQSVKKFRAFIIENAAFILIIGLIILVTDDAIFASQHHFVITPWYFVFLAMQEFLNASMATSPSDKNKQRFIVWIVFFCKVVYQFSK